MINPTETGVAMPAVKRKRKPDKTVRAKQLSLPFVDGFAAREIGGGNHAEQIKATGQDNARGRPQSGVRPQGGDTAERGRKIRGGRRQARQGGAETAAEAG